MSEPPETQLDHVLRQQMLTYGTAFDIYKRCCDRADIGRWAREYGIEIRVEHVEPAFYAVAGTFSRTSGS